MAVRSITERLENGPSITVCDTPADVPDPSKGGLRIGDRVFVLDPPQELVLRPDSGFKTVDSLLPLDGGKLGWVEESSVADDDVIIFLDATTGDDANDGLTPATAILTIDRLRQILPLAWKKKCQAHFAPGTYPWPAPQTLRLQRFPVGMVVPSSLDAEDMVWVGGLDVVLPQFTAQAGTTNVKIVTPGGLAIDAFRGATVEVLTGNAQGRRVSVASNDATTLFLGRNANGLMPTDQVRLVRPNVIVDFNDPAQPGDQGQFFATGGPNCSFFATSIKFRSNGFGTGYSFEGCTVGTTMCEFEINAGTLFFFKKTRYNGAFPNVGEGGSSFFDVLNRTSLYAHSTDEDGSSLHVLDYAEFQSDLITEKMLVISDRYSYTNVNRWDGVNSAAQAIDQGQLYISNRSFQLPDVSIRKLALGQAFIDEGFSTVPGAVLTAFNGSILGAFDAIIGTNTVTAMRGDQNAQLIAFDVTGTANGDAGIQVTNHSVAIIGSDVTVTGAVTDIELGSDGVQTNFTYADPLLTAPPFAVSDARGNRVMIYVNP